ncbi:MAG: hypothetical protein PVJ39_05825 [Gammaproteobacteria bacterium]|jgi:hypothetical protein
MKTNKYLLMVVSLAAVLGAAEIQALEVDREVVPRMTLGGRVIATLDAVNLDSDPEAEDEINLSDSSLLTRFDKRLFSNGVAGAVVGLSENEASITFNQLHAFYWNRNYRAEIGRNRLRNSIIEFPLIRDDDLLAYTHVGNGSSNDEFDQIYGKHIAFDWVFDKKIQSLGLWAGTRRNGEETVFADAPSGIDSYGLGYTYEQPEDLVYVEKLRHAGVWLDRQQVETAGDTEWMTAVIAGVEFNLNDDPGKNWSLALQAIANNGIDNVGGLASVAERARAKSNAFVASLRYTGRPHLLTRYQGAVTVAWKDYADFDNATQWSVAPSAVYRIGQGIDLIGQVKFTDYGAGLVDGSDTSVYLGIAFSLETMFNDNIGERDSILNLEHSYIQ